MHDGKIRLSFRKMRDIELEKMLPDYGHIIRLICSVKFKTPHDWTKIHNAIVDTGAHTSVIPLEIWQDIETNILLDYQMRGIVPKEECKVPIKIAKVKAILFDEFDNKTPELELFAFLSLTKDVPLILGFKSLLEKFRVCFDYKENRGFIETRNKK